MEGNIPQAELRFDAATLLAALNLISARDSKSFLTLKGMDFHNPLSVWTGEDGLEITILISHSYLARLQETYALHTPGENVVLPLKFICLKVDQMGCF